MVIELLDEIIELALLLEEVGASGAGGLLLQRTMRALMTAVLLWMAGLKALDADTQSQPPDRELGKIEQPLGEAKGTPLSTTYEAALGSDPIRSAWLLSSELTFDLSQSSSIATLCPAGEINFYARPLISCARLERTE
jgi:hypothetical protein